MIENITPENISIETTEDDTKIFNFTELLTEDDNTSNSFSSSGAITTTPLQPTSNRAKEKGAILMKVILMLS